MVHVPYYRKLERSGSLLDGVKGGKHLSRQVNLAPTCVVFLDFYHLDTCLDVKLRQSLNKSNTHLVFKNVLGGDFLTILTKKVMR